MVFACSHAKTNAETITPKKTARALAVFLGVIVSALVFAWEHAKTIRVQTKVDDKGWKIYELEGTLFFASIANFQTLFAPNSDPNDVVIDFKYSRVADHSAITAIDSLARESIAVIAE